ncbi:MAG: enolase C-terminal domain-like protein [Actinomycetes bacterium]
MATAATITGLDVVDVRFPTSRFLDGSDAMNPDPDYSAAYVVLRTDGDRADGSPLDGHALAFTIGRGNDVQVAAIRALEHHVVGRDVDELAADLGGLARGLARDSQFRWLGPEKGIAHMALGAVVNAAWDLASRRAELPLWRFLVEMTPEQIVALVDFRHISDALSPDQSLDLLRAAAPGRAARLADLETNGYPAYTTGAGWLGYDDAKLERLAAEAAARGYRQVKLKVGADPAADERRLRIARGAIGPDVGLAVDANQIWDVDEAIARVNALAHHDLAWIEEPTSPDDVLGHARIRAGVSPVPVATGEHMHNRVMAKQFLQAGALDVLQIDAARVGGVNENLAMLRLAAAFGVRVCPHAGGVGLCEMVQHLSFFDAVAVSGTTEGRMIEHVDHLHEHFVDPVTVVDGRYLLPTGHGLNGRMHQESIDRHRFPDGAEWRAGGAS